MQSDKDGVFEANAPVGRPKKPYVSPRLIVHGTVAKITQALGNAGGDALNGSLI
jgi:hypothetical protein